MAKDQSQIDLLNHRIYKGPKSQVVSRIWYFVFDKIQVLICMQNYAIASPFRANLVIVKGTEYYDNNKNRLVDYTPNEVMQMMSRAGRPSIDTVGIANLLVCDIFEEYYRKFMFEPFPVESNILDLDQITLKNFLVPKQALDIANRMSEVAIEERSNSQLSEEHQRNNLKKTTKRNNKPEDKSKEDLVLSKRRKLIKDVASKRLSATFLVYRLQKNPSFYKLRDVKSMKSFLDKFLDTNKILYDENS